MILLIDWGNSRCKAACGSMASPSRSPIQSVSEWSADDGESVEDWLCQTVQGLPEQPAALGLVSVVAEERTQALVRRIRGESWGGRLALERLEARTDHAPWMPAGLGTGADRRAHLWGLAARIRAPSAVDAGGMPTGRARRWATAWSCGTASVMDRMVLDAESDRALGSATQGSLGHPVPRWLGGSIAPGLAMAMAGLRAQTAALGPHLAAAAEGRAVGSDLGTEASLARGIWQGLLGPLRAALAEGEERGLVLLHGGWAPQAERALGELLGIRATQAPHLVFEGLLAWMVSRDRGAGG